MTKRSRCGFLIFKTNRMMTQGELIHELVTIVEECFKTISYSLLQMIPSVLIPKHLTSQSVICNQLDMGNHPYTLRRKFNELLIRHYLEDKWAEDQILILTPLNPPFSSSTIIKVFSHKQLLLAPQISPKQSRETKYRNKWAREIVLLYLVTPKGQA